MEKIVVEIDEVLKVDDVAKIGRLLKYWRTHREQIQHLAEQWGISVVLNLTEQQCGVQAAIELFLEEAKKHE